MKTFTLSKDAVLPVGTTTLYFQKPEFIHGDFAHLDFQVDPGSSADANIAVSSWTALPTEGGIQSFTKTATGPSTDGRVEDIVLYPVIRVSVTVGTEAAAVLINITCSER